MIGVREAFSYAKGDFVFTHSPDGATRKGPGYHERLVIERIDYRGREGVAVDFTLHTTSGRQLKPSDIKAFGCPDKELGYRFDPPFKSTDVVS